MSDYNWWFFFHIGLPFIGGLICMALAIMMLFGGTALNEAGYLIMAWWLIKVARRRYLSL